ncbi:hypothetical protein OAB57_03140 [Bacteriovoracaceae bacterium]|nr:hypothetical protein [Bacteriovoracaceae bacterium]
MRDLCMVLFFYVFSIECLWAQFNMDKRSIGTSYTRTNKKEKINIAKEKKEEVPKKKVKINVKEKTKKTSKELMLRTKRSKARAEAYNLRQEKQKEKLKNLTEARNIKSLKNREIDESKYQSEKNEYLEQYKMKASDEDGLFVKPQKKKEK